MMRLLVLAAVAIAIMTAATYSDEIAAWRTQREERLKAELEERSQQAAWWGNKAREELAGDKEEAARPITLDLGEPLRRGGDVAGGIDR